VWPGSRPRFKGGFVNLLKEIRKWYRGFTLEISKEIKEPVRDGKVAIADSEQQLMKFRQAAIDLLAQTDILRKNRDSIQVTVNQLDQVAKQAAKEKNHHTLELAVSRKLADELQIKTFDEVIEQNDILIEQFQNQFNVALAKLQRAKLNLVSLSARQEAAKVRQLVGEAAAPIQSDQPGLASLDNLEKSVEEAEAKARATENFQPDVNIEEQINRQAVVSEMDRYLNKHGKKPIG
jgi:phage shock protein A